MPYFLQGVLIVVAVILTLGLAAATFSGRRDFKGMRSWVFFGISFLAATWAVYLIRRINLNGGYTGNLYPIFTVIFFAVLMGKIIHSSYLTKSSRIKKEKKGHSLSRIAYVSMAATVLIFNIVLPILFGNYDLIWMGIIGFFAFDILFLINIIKNDHFDIRESYLHILLYSFVIAFVLGVYLIVLKIVYQFVFRIPEEDQSFEIYMVNILLAVIAIFLLPLINEANYFIKRYIYVDRYNIDALVARINTEILGAKNLEKTLNTISRLIVKELCVNEAYFVVSSPDRTALVAGKRRHRLSQSEIISVTRNIAAGTGKLLGQDIVLVDDLPHDIESVGILREHRFAALVKIFVPEKDSGRKLAGFLLVGHKKRHRKIDERRRKALAIIAGLTALAITNIEYYNLLKQKKSPKTSEKSDL
jgi:hypothetical protein